ncbi:hypothetical protein [Yersinia rohdei]|nr:hypothetical protein [Yersinia rohdei]
MPDAWTMDVYNELLDKGFFDIISRKSLEQANKKKPQPQKAKSPPEWA